MGSYTGIAQQHFWLISSRGVDIQQLFIVALCNKHMITILLTSFIVFELLGNVFPPVRLRYLFSRLASLSFS